MGGRLSHHKFFHYGTIVGHTDSVYTRLCVMSRDFLFCRECRDVCEMTLCMTPPLA
jgi:hypothetical protein